MAGEPDSCHKWPSPVPHGILSHPCAQNAKAGKTPRTVAHGRRLSPATDHQLVARSKGPPLSEAEPTPFRRRPTRANLLLVQRIAGDARAEADLPANRSTCPALSQ